MCIYSFGALIVTYRHMRMASSSSSFSSASMALGDEKPHVLAVDDSLLDRKLIEKLLTNSSCKGIYKMPPLSFSLSWFS